MLSGQRRGIVLSIAAFRVLIWAVFIAGAVFGGGVTFALIVLL